jgi:hypothetical protein
VGATLVLLWSARAGAAPAEPEDFDQLIHRGVQLRKQGDDEKAKELFQRAYTISKTPRAAAQLGLVEDALKHFEASQGFLSEALEAHEPWIEAHRKVLEDTLADVRKQLARIEIVGAAPGTTVVLGDGRSLALPANGTLWLAPGSIAMRIESPGSNSVTRLADAKPGDHVTIDVSAPLASKTTVAPPPAPAPSTPEAPTPKPAEVDDPGRHLRIAGLATGAAGVALGVTGVVLYQIAGTKLDHIKGAIGGGGSWSNSDRDWQTYDHAGVGLMIGGGVAVAAGATMYFLGHRARSVGNVSVGFLPRGGAGVACMQGVF